MAFDNQLNMVGANSGVVQVPQISEGETAQPLVAPEQIIQKDGYLYIYVSNESAQKVFFDNLVIHHNKGHLLEEDQYYPFGLKMAGISDQALPPVPNNYLYNGKEFNNDEFSDGSGLDWYSYGMREYDPQLARFPQLDPLTDEFPTLTPYQYAGNDPVANIDLDGLESVGVLNAGASGAKDFTYMYSAASDATAIWNPVMHAAKAASISGKFVHVVLPGANMVLHAVQVTGTIINGPITTKEAGDAANNRPQVGPGPRPLGPIGQLFMMTVGQGLADLNTILTGRDGNNNKVGPGGRVMSGLNLLMLGAVGDEGEVPEVPEMKGEIPEIKEVGHHSDPKFMGGDPKQRVTPMKENEHIQLHKDLNNHLINQKDAFGNHMRPQRNNSDVRIQNNFSPEQRLNALKEFYKGTGAKYNQAAEDFFKQHPDLK